MMHQTNILLVDDETQFVSALAERLSMRGFSADWACSGQEALDKVENNHFDLAILDVKMPNISGLELKRKLSERAPGLRFIFFTGHGSEEAFRTCSAEAETVLVKPLKIEELVATIHCILNADQTEA